MKSCALACLSLTLGAGILRAAADGFRLNELLVNAPKGWLELANPTPLSAPLSGVEIRLLQGAQSQSWRWGPDWELGPGSFLVLSLAELGLEFSPTGGRIELWSSAGTRLEVLDYGPQLPMESIGRVGERWVLLAAPSPGNENGAAADLDELTAVRLNEWLPTSAVRPGWIELFNPGQRPVNLAGAWLRHHESGTGRAEFVFAPLSLIEPLGWQVFQAHPGAAASAWNTGLDLGPTGAALQLFSPGGLLVDSVTPAAALSSLSQGRLPDGGSFIAALSQGTPGRMNQSDFDTDADGMGDGWEVRYRLEPTNPADAAADPDQDGLSNLEEFRAGRNPRAHDPPIPVLAELSSLGRLSLRFRAEAGTSYSILVGEKPEAVTELFVPFIADGLARTVEITDDPAQARFYQVVTPARAQSQSELGRRQRP